MPRERLRTRLRRARRRGGLAPLRDEGAVAVITALCVSTFLIGFAALAVDFGQIYTRQGSAQSVSDLAALSAASALPDLGVAQRKAAEVACAATDNGWSAEVQEECKQFRNNGTIPDWADNGDPGDGEVVFYVRDQDHDGYDAGDEVAPGATEATAVRVLMPRSTVTFGLARTFGADDFDVQEAATARIGTALGQGMMPFAITTADLTPAKQNTFCVIDPLEDPPVTDNYPGPRPPPLHILWLSIPQAPAISITPASMPYDAGPGARTITISGGWLAPNPFPADTKVYFGSPGRQLAATPVQGGRRLQVQAPGVSPGDVYKIWVEYGTGAGRVRSYTDSIGFTNPTGVQEPCSRPEAIRGYGNDDRTPPVAADGAELVANIQRGVQPEVRRWPEDPGVIALLQPLLAALGATGPVGSAQCGILNPLLTGLGRENLQPVTEGLLGYVNCVEVQHTKGFADSMTTGLLQAGAGRDTGLLTRQCTTAPEIPVTGGSFTIDNSNLLHEPSELVRDSVGGDADALRAAIRAGAPPRQGWIKNEAFRCPRLMALPVIDVDKALDDNSQYPIVDIKYAWIDDGSAGLLFSDPNTLRAFRGYVIEPGYFPDTVTDSPVVGEYLGDYLPKQAVLVHDQSDIP